MADRQTASEAFVYRICRSSFLSLWSYASPQGKKAGKQLCDILVVCDPDIIIISVKEIGPDASGDPEVATRRWSKKAIDDSVKQIYGAERVLAMSNRVIRADGSQGLPLPTREHRRVHRIAIALGGGGRMPISFGDFGKGFVHVLDELSLDAVMRELNTISDFADYLKAKEAITSSAAIVFDGGEEDLLALYLHNGRSFPSCDGIVVGDGLWEAIREKPEYQRKLEADRDSYAWDGLIEIWGKDILSGNIEFGPKNPTDAEAGIRVMAKENRFNRRILGKSFLEFQDGSSRGDIEARKVVSPSGAVYVFLALPHGTERRLRVRELELRCFVARGLHNVCSCVVGLATERYVKGKGFSFDLVMLRKPDWTREDQERMDGIQQDLGYFSSPRVTRIDEDEYPVGKKAS